MNISDIIILQLAGTKQNLISTVGAYDFNSSGRNLKFKFKHPAKNIANAVEIILEQNDTYTVKFLSVKALKSKVISEEKSVLCFSLKEIFEIETGINL